MKRDVQSHQNNQFQWQNDHFIDGRVLCGELSLPLTGLVLIEGENGVGKTSLMEKLKNSSAFFSQNSALAAQVPLEQVLELEVGLVLDYFLKNFKQDFYPAKYCQDLKDKLEVGHLMNKYFSQLSGGEKQLIKLWYTFCLDKNIYILDEPFQNLDKSKIIKIASVIKDLSVQFPVIVIDHLFSIINSTIIDPMPLAGHYHMTLCNRVVTIKRMRE